MSLVQKLSRTRMALKHCIRTDNCWNKNTTSRASLETAEILRPKSSTNQMADALIGLSDIIISFYTPNSKGSQGLKTKLEWLLVWWIHRKRVVQKHRVKTLDRIIIIIIILMHVVILQVAAPMLSRVTWASLRLLVLLVVVQMWC